MGRQRPGAELAWPLERLLTTWELKAILARCLRETKVYVRKQGWADWKPVDTDRERNILQQVGPTNEVCVA